MKKLLIICGPTATGKTALALRLAKEFSGELVSADSRQVYKYMDVVTGKDIPKEFSVQSSEISFQNRSISYYSDGKTRIWGYDVIRPDEEWSVKLFQDFATHVISDIYKRGRLPIVVGGTGLYLKALIEPMPFLSIPRYPELRKKLVNKSSNELFDLLTTEWPERAAVMNESDRQNPRRLIRAIEIADYRKVRPFRTEGSDLQKRRPYPFSTLWIGLSLNNPQKLYERIDERVDQRVGPRLGDELEFLKKKAFFGAVPSQTIGYRQWIRYMAGEVSKEEAIRQWKFSEHDYARRQLVWFKKQPAVHWFDVTTPGCHDHIVTFVRQWYDDRHGGKQR